VHVGGGHSAHADAPVPFEVLVKTGVATLCFHERSLETARTPAEWASLWQRTCFPVPAPAVDFQHDMVIVYFMGQQPSGGYRPRSPESTGPAASSRWLSLTTFRVADSKSRRTPCLPSWCIDGQDLSCWNVARNGILAGRPVA